MRDARSHHVRVLKYRNRLTAAFREYLEDRTPKKRHATEIVVDALLFLHEHEYMETDTQGRLYVDCGPECCP